MDRPRHHRCNLSNANAQQLTCLLKDLQQCMQGASNFPQHINKTLTLPFQLSFIGEMQFRMAIIPILLKASLKQNRVIGEQQLNIYKQMEGQTNFQLMLEESADMYAGLELEYEKQKLEFEGLKYRTRKLIYSCAAILESVRALLQKERDLPELMALLQSKDFLYICEGIMVEAATDLLDSYLQHNTELVAVTIFLLQRISELADGKKALIELEMEHNRNNNDRKTLIWALIVLFCKQSNSRQNIVLIILAYTTSKEGAKLLISHQLDKILVSMMHSETDNSIKETSVDILCSLVSLNDARCLRMFRSSPEAAAEFIKTLKREGSVKIRRMADYLAGKFLEQLEYNGPKMAKPR